jgi:hypothetical protein
MTQCLQQMHSCSIGAIDIILNYLSGMIMCVTNGVECSYEDSWKIIYGNNVRLMQDGANVDKQVAAVYSECQRSYLEWAAFGKEVDLLPNVLRSTAAVSERLSAIQETMIVVEAQLEALADMDVDARRAASRDVTENATAALSRDCQTKEGIEQERVAKASHTELAALNSRLQKELVYVFTFMITRHARMLVQMRQCCNSTDSDHGTSPSIETLNPSRRRVRRKQ